MGLITRRAAGGLRGIDVTTGPYPEFATDLQAPTMALLTLATGASTIAETVFEQRFRHIEELHQVDDMSIANRTALVRGVPRLVGASATCTDVRAAAALVIAALNASGKSVLDGLDHLDRGYDRMAEKLAAVGADIVRSYAGGASLRWRSWSCWERGSPDPLRIESGSGDPRSQQEASLLRRDGHRLLEARHGEAELVELGDHVLAGLLVGLDQRRTHRRPGARRRRNARCSTSGAGIIT